jgi:hypothetical protein
MDRRRFIGQMIGAALLLGAGRARAEPVGDVVSALRGQGYRIKEVRKTLLGRVRIVAETEVVTREVVLDPRTGEIRRDLEQGTRAEASRGRSAPDILESDTVVKHGDRNSSRDARGSGGSSDMGASASGNERPPALSQPVATTDTETDSGDDDQTSGGNGGGGRPGRGGDGNVGGNGGGSRPGRGDGGNGASGRPGRGDGGNGASGRPGRGDGGNGASGRPGRGDGGNGASGRPGRGGSGNGASGRPGRGGGGSSGGKGSGGAGSGGRGGKGSGDNRSGGKGSGGKGNKR